MAKADSQEQTGSTIGTAHLRIDGTIAEVAETTASWTGRGAETLVGRDFFDTLSTGEARRRFLALDPGSLAIGVPGLPIAFDLRAASGTFEPVIGTVSRVDAARVILSLARAAPPRDVEDELKTARQRNDILAAVVDASSDAILGVGVDRTVTFWNRGAESLYGYAADEILGRSLSILAPEERASEVDLYIDRVLAGESVVFEALRKRRDGGFVEVAITSAPMLDAAGAVFGVSAIHREIGPTSRSAEHLRQIMRELSHRTKNLLAIIQAMARQTSRTAASVEAFHVSFTARLQALAASHDLLVEENWVGARMADLVRSQLAVIAFSGAQLSASGPAVLLTPVAAQNLGLALHELATNASKHGALSNVAGVVAIRWRLNAPDGDLPARFVVDWVERQGPTVSAPSRSGFGRVVIDQMMARALNAEVRIDFAASGFSWTASMPATYVMVVDETAVTPGEVSAAPERV